MIGIIMTLASAAVLGVVAWVTWLAATATDLVPAVQGPDAPTDDVPDMVTVHTGNNLGTFFLGLLCFALLLLVLYLAFQTRRYYKLRYALDRNAITVDLGDSKQVIPLANIRHVVPAETVLNQMRNRVYSGTGEAENATPGGAVNTSYPRQQPADETVESGGVLQTETVEVEVAQVEEEELSHQMTQTAAADSDLDEVEPVDVVQAEFVEISEAPAADGGRSPEIEEGQVTELEPEEVKALAVTFDETAENERGQTSSEQSKRQEVPDSFARGSVNFSVKTQSFGHWPGFYTNRAQVASIGAVQFYSTQPFEKTLLVRTDYQTYAISPQNRQQFITEFNLRRRLGAIEPVEEGIVQGSFLTHPLWHDKIGRSLIAAGVILNLLLYFLLLWRFDDINPILRIHFNKLGQVDRAGDKSELMFLPFIGLMAVVVNSIFGAIIQPKERVPAYLLYAGAILVQILTGIAVLVILAVS
ncbi:MAG TPA: PH domain-containing protein [Chloroflexia bacterium]|nr:PH domain-containing protein [Chloroflexia bacterium]